MASDLNEVLRRLYDAGAVDVPAHDIDWREDMIPVLMQALNMGYVHYRQRGDVKHFYLTKFGYEAIGIVAPKFSPFRILLEWISGHS